MERLAGTTTALALVVGVGLALVPSAAAAQQLAPKADEEQQTRTIQVKILGMSCPFCAYGAEQKLKRLEGVEELEVDLESGIATLGMEEDADVSNERLKETVEDAGFETSAIVRSFESEFEDWNPEELEGGRSNSAPMGEAARHRVSPERTAR